MQLRLKYAPVPENAARFAGDIVVSAAQVSGVHLDYTPDSLTSADAILDGFRAEGLASGQVAETLFGFGCYVGEVLTRHAGGRWQQRRQTNWPSSDGPWWSSSAGSAGAIRLRRPSSD